MTPNYNSTPRAPHNSLRAPHNPGAPLQPIFSQGGVMGCPSDRCRYAAPAPQPTIVPAFASRCASRTIAFAPSTPTLARSAGFGRGEGLLLAGVRLRRDSWQHRRFQLASVENLYNSRASRIPPATTRASSPRSSPSGLVPGRSGVADPLQIFRGAP